MRILSPFEYVLPSIITEFAAGTELPIAFGSIAGVTVVLPPQLTKLILAAAAIKAKQIVNAKALNGFPILFLIDKYMVVLKLSVKVISINLVLLKNTKIFSCHYYIWHSN
jgi:hypothetical protein